MTEQQVLTALAMRTAGNPASIIAEKLGVPKEKVKYHFDLVDRAEARG